MNLLYSLTFTPLCNASMQHELMDIKVEVVEVNDQVDFVFAQQIIQEGRILALRQDTSGMTSNLLLTTAMSSCGAFRIRFEKNGELHPQTLDRQGSLLSPLLSCFALKCKGKTILICCRCQHFQNAKICQISADDYLRLCVYLPVHCTLWI